MSEPAVPPILMRVVRVVAPALYTALVIWGTATAIRRSDAAVERMQKSLEQIKQDNAKTLPGRR